MSGDNITLTQDGKDAVVAGEFVVYQTTRPSPVETSGVPIEKGGDGTRYLSNAGTPYLAPQVRVAPIKLVNVYTYVVDGLGADQDFFLDCRSLLVGNNQITLPRLAFIETGKRLIIKGGDATIGVANVLVVKADPNDSIDGGFLGGQKDITATRGWIDLVGSADKTTWLMLGSMIT